MNKHVMTVAAIGIAATVGSYFFLRKFTHFVGIAAVAAVAWAWYKSKK